MIFFECPCIAALALWSCKDAPPPVAQATVVVATVGQRDVRVEREFIGTTEGTIDAKIRAQVSGYILSREYQEGTLVTSGELLFRIDARPFEAALDQARGELERARAALAKADQDVARFTPLAREGAVSQQELDNAVQSARAARAAVQSAKAAVEGAEVDLAFTEIRSPIHGIAGVANAQVGDLVGPSTSEPLTTISQVDPIRVSTPISERDYLRVAREIRGSLEHGPRAERTRLELILVDGSVHPHEGHVVVAGREVDPTTGTIVLKSAFPNPELTLRPGQYARVRIAAEVIDDAIVVPQRAVTELQGTYQVAVVDPQDVVQMRVVELGPRTGADVVVQRGLDPEERIVVDGIQKVRNGAKVNPRVDVAAPPAAPPDEPASTEPRSGEGS